MNFDNFGKMLDENKKTIIPILVIILTTILISICNLFFQNKNRGTDVKSALEDLAESYYNQYYSEIISQHGDFYKEKLQQDEKKGIKLTLRTLINTFDNVNAENFIKNGSNCNFIETYIVIYPKTPYSVKDYRLETNIECNKEG